MSAQPKEITQKPKNTRRVDIRMATNAEGDRIHELVMGGGFTVDGIDWSHIAPFWLVAERNGAIIGCVQVSLSLPIGHVEMLAIDPKVSKILRAVIVKHLLLSACATLLKAGAQMASGLIPFEMKSYKRLLKRHGCVSLGVGNQMARRL